MQVTNLLYRIYAKPGNMAGFLTKKQCVHISTEVGKELADLKKSGVEITREVFEKVVRQKAPQVKMPNVASTEQEIVDLGTKRGFSESQMHTIFQSLDKNDIFACHSDIIDGIYVPFEKLKLPEHMNTLAHEFQHHLYNTTTVKKRFQKWIRAKAYAMKLKHMEKQAANQPQTAQKVSESVPKMRTDNFDERMEASNIYSQIESDLQELFRIGKPGQIPLIAKKTGDPKIFKRFYATEYYNGLTDEKRINAYIRAIIRHHIHPKNKDSMQFLIGLRNTLQDEALAYEVSDKVIAHVTPYPNGTTGVGIIADVYRRAVKIIYDELKIAVVECGKHEDLLQKGLPIKKYKTGLPTSAVVQRDV